MLVEPGDRTAEVMYVGKISEIAPGYWIGVCYDEPVGKNDGSVKGRRCFECALFMPTPCCPSFDAYPSFAGPPALPCSVFVPCSPSRASARRVGTVGTCSDLPARAHNHSSTCKHPHTLRCSLFALDGGRCPLDYGGFLRPDKIKPDLNPPAQRQRRGGGGALSDGGEMPAAAPAAEASTDAPTG